MQRFAGLLSLVLFAGLFAQGEQKPFQVTRCEIVPLARNEVSLRIDGIEKTRWHYGNSYPRPFLFPVNGPSGVSLTRMGHPGAQNHDHHRSLWMAHAKIEGEDYWSENGGTQVVQKHWYAYEDGDDEAILASKLGWYSKAGTKILEQDFVVALIPMERGEYGLEFHLTFRPGEGRESVNLEKTNFGILAVRVAKTLSHHFGGGELRSSEGGVGEKEIFAKPARWMDYSGPVVSVKGTERKTVTEGITFFDHPENPRYPTHWHVRSDGWMGAAFCLQDEFVISAETPLRLRYFLHIHGGGYDQKRAESIAKQFGEKDEIVVRKSERPHRQFEAVRLEK